VIDHHTKFDVMKIFTGSTTPLPRPRFLVTRMLSRDLFSVATFLVIHALQLLLTRKTKVFLLR